MLPFPPHRSILDLEGLQEGMLALMHSLDEKLVYGCYKVRGGRPPRRAAR